MTLKTQQMLLKGKQHQITEKILTLFSIDILKNKTIWDEKIKDIKNFVNLVIEERNLKKCRAWLVHIDH